MDNGFNFIYQPHKLMQFQDFSHQRKQNNMKDNQSITFSHGISAHLEKQGMEIDRFINLQNERLRLAFHEQRKQQTALILKFYESKTRFLLQQKEAEIADASNRTLELQKYIKRMEIENQTWQRVAKENESMVASLNNTIQRLTGTGCVSAEDASSCCENREENSVQRIRKMVCRCCNSGSSRVIILPCRHMCSCKHCEVFLDSCPVCGMVKDGSIESLI